MPTSDKSAADTVKSAGITNISTGLILTCLYENKYLNNDVMDAQFRALSDPIRREILRGLSKGELRAGDIAAVFSVTRPAISHHLKVLSEAGLIAMRRSAQSRLYSINHDAVKELLLQFNRFWDDALPRLKSVVESDQRARRKRRHR